MVHLNWIKGKHVVNAGRVLTIPTYSDGFCQKHICCTSSCRSMSICRESQKIHRNLHQISEMCGWFWMILVRIQRILLGAIVLRHTLIWHRIGAIFCLPPPQQSSRPVTTVQWIQTQPGDHWQGVDSRNLDVKHEVKLTLIKRRSTLPETNGSSPLKKGIPNRKVL